MNLAIAAIFKNESPYLKEWLDFHLLVGFEHFYLFDNLSSDNPKRELAPYIERGVVELTSWPIDHSDIFEWNEVQCLAYERVIYRACGKAGWLAILDVDEFLFSVEEPILEVLKRFEEYGGVGVNWQMFGTSGIEKVPQGKRMVEVLNFRLPTSQGVNHHVKSIVRPERVQGCENPHSMLYREGFFQVNMAHVPFEGRLSPTVQTSPLRINHYTLRDEHFLATQKIPRLQKWWGGSASHWRQKYGGMNQVEDRTIHQFLPFLPKNPAD